MSPDPTPEPIPTVEWRRQPLAMIFFVGIAGLIVWAVAQVLAPFITPILLAAIIVTFTFPLYKRLRTRLGGRENLAASLMLLLVTVTLILPAFLLMLLLIEQATDLFRLMQQTDYGEMIDSLHIRQRFDRLAGAIPGVRPPEIKLDQMIVSTVERIPGWVASYGGRILASLTNIVIGFIFMLLAAFFFYIEGEMIVAELKTISPLPDEYEAEIVAKFIGVVNATFRGQILTALAQGAVTAIGLVIAGVPGALFWGAVAAVFSLLPVIGAFAVWMPATLYLLAVHALRDDPLWPAIFLALWGFTVVSLVDNLIRPWAMRQGTNMSAILLFFSILGGIRAFGFVGLILGPLVFALFVSIVHMYKFFFHPSLVDARGEVIGAGDSSSG